MMTKDEFTLGLVRQRQAVKLTQADAARKLGVTRGHLNHVETGDTLPGLALLLRMATTYGATLGLLLKLDGGMDTREAWLTRILAALDALRGEY